MPSGVPSPPPNLTVYCSAVRSLQSAPLLPGLEPNLAPGELQGVWKGAALVVLTFPLPRVAPRSTQICCSLFCWTASCAATVVAHAFAAVVRMMSCMFAATVEAPLLPLAPLLSSVQPDHGAFLRWTMLTGWRVGRYRCRYLFRSFALLMGFLLVTIDAPIPSPQPDLLLSWR